MDKAKWEAQRRYREKHRELCNQRSLAQYYAKKKEWLARRKEWGQSLRGKLILKKWMAGYKKSGQQRNAQRKSYYKNIEKLRKKAREWYHKNKETALRNHKKWASSKRGKQVIGQYIAKRIHKTKANYAIRNAQRRGEVFKLPCSVCGNKRSEAHHPDYSKPLSVVWLCRKHHAEVHKK